MFGAYFRWIGIFVSTLLILQESQGRARWGDFGNGDGFTPQFESGLSDKPGLTVIPKTMRRPIEAAYHEDPYVDGYWIEEYDGGEWVESLNDDYWPWYVEPPRMREYPTRPAPRVRRPSRSQARPGWDQRPPSRVQPRRPAPVPRRPADRDDRRDDDRASARPAQPAVSGKMLSLGSTRRLAHGPAYQWNGCDRSAIIQGGQGRRCGTDYLHPSFAEHIDKNLLSCAQTAAARAGHAPPVKLFITHMGCYANRSVRGGGRLSNHALARAMDISAITMTDANGREVRMNAHVRNYGGSNKTMYDTFRDCWRRSLPRSCSGQKGSIGIPRSQLGGNGQHNDHLHLEFPARCG